MRAVVVVVVLAACLAPATAHAQSPTLPRVDVTWTAPAGVCPPAEAFVAETEQALGPPGAAPGEPLRVDARVVRGADGRLVLELVMHFADGDTSRALVAAGCDALIHAGALVVALALAPERAVSVEEPPAPPTPPPTPPAPAPPPPPVAPPERARAGLEIVALGLVDLGSMPSAAPGGAFGGGVRFVDLHLEALFVVLPAGEGRLALYPAAGGRFTLLAGRLGAAIDLARADPLTLALSLAVELGDLTGRGFGVTMPASADVLFALVAAGARVTYDLGPVSLRVDVESFAPFARQPFSVGTLGEVYTPSAVGLRVGLGAAVHFP